jgi:ferrous iron transport protein A
LRLSELKIGHKAVITGFANDHTSVQLMEMGCIPGEVVTLISKAPLGDPMAVMVSGYKLSIRGSEAIYIYVDPILPENISVRL